MSKRKMPFEDAKELARNMIAEDADVYYKDVMAATGLSETAVQNIRRSFTIRSKLGAGRYKKIVAKLTNTTMPVPEIAELFGVSGVSVKAVAEAERICPDRRRIQALKKPKRKPQGGEVLRTRTHESMSGDLRSLKWLRYNWGCKPGPRESSYYFGRVW